MTLFDKRLYHKPTILSFILAAASGLLLYAAFPKPAIFPLAWVALVPFFVATRHLKPGHALLLGLITGTVFFACHMSWITIFGYVPWLGLAVFQGLFIAAFALISNLIVQKTRISSLIVIPSVWTALEYIRSLGMMGLSWGGVSYSQAPWTSIVQVSSITGPWGVTFLILLVNVAIARSITDYNKQSMKQLGFAISLVTLSSLGGWLYIENYHWPTPDKKIALVQGNIELTYPDQRVDDDIIRTYWPMTENIKGFDYIVWPESALPGDIVSSPVLRFSVGQLARNTNSHMIVGGMHDEPSRKVKTGYSEFNGAYLIDPKGVLIGSYYKTHLVPFGEFVPGRKWIPFINKFPVLDTDRSPGKGYYPICNRSNRIGVMICFESAFPQIGRKLATRGSDMLLVITNDSWFKRTAAAAQHHEFSIFRAVENRRYLGMNSTTGISSIITPWGKVEKSVGLGVKATVTGKIADLHERTIYTRYGDWFAWLCIFGTLWGLVASLTKREKSVEHPR